MDKKLFSKLVESMHQMDAIVRAMDVCSIRERTGLSQASFAKLIDVPVSTVRNWEQGRREPQGPARALLKALSVDPVHVIKAIRANKPL